ncbi:MAG: gliding motility-associated ABC transporter ATP-binding subunit GldA [Flavobacteriales bacterium]|nr:gliding motility-associated ABC transporter ATP-binding subunit GldA [Flavobacteriales bacterium]
MSIQAQSVSRYYGKQQALKEVSFSIAKGEVVGFLGPNGAGKSTMMKIITCYIPPSSGDVNVCGFDVLKQSLEVRRRIGYLPEHNPLYTDMYVREYLAFAAEMNGMRRPSKRVEEMIERVGLGIEAHKKIEALSKGYRQRVGLAQALIHDPEVLILDEPTSGLDPNQLVGIRSLITDLGKEKTVMLSTHIMQEVEALCSRAIIINRGTIVADEPTSALKSGKFGQEQVVEVEFSGPVEQGWLLAIAGIRRLEPSGNFWRVYAAGDRDIRPDLSQLAASKGLTILTLARKEQKLEDVFKELTAE